MAPPRPDPDRVRQAISIYLAVAYEGAPPPVTVRSLLAVLRSWGGEFYDCPIFAPDAATPPTRYSSRLGNPHYPHMKLVIQLSPHEDAWLFRADSHDKHCLPPPTSPEYHDFVALMEKNQKLVEKIEAAWADSGIPTFKAYLREDLARRARAAQGDAPGGH